MNSSPSWLVRLSPQSVDGPTLLICPHAGGGPVFYRALAAALFNRLTVWAVNYPGRERQVQTPLADSMHSLVNSIVDQIPRHLPGTFVLLGHSMGAFVAQEVAVQLAHQIHGVIVSAQTSPLTQQTDRELLHQANDETLLRAVESLGASPASLLQHPEFKQQLLPLLRRDFQITETHHPRTEPLHVPLIAYAGEQDTLAPPENMRSWEHLTTAEFRYRIFPGGHFYFTDDVHTVAHHLHHDVMWFPT